MIRKVIKIGGEHGVVINATLLKAMNLKVGDKVHVTVQTDGAIRVTPIRSPLEPSIAASMAKQVIKENSEVFRRLSKM